MTTKTKRKITPPPFKVEVPIIEKKPGDGVSSWLESGLSPLPWLTLEVGVYAIIFALALILRWWQLDVYPLSNAEATQSLIALQLYRGNALEGGVYSPLLLTLNALTFLLFGASDTTARLASVLLGSLLVVLPLTFRRRLGSMICLLAAALLAISPTALFMSRAINNEMGVAVGALMLIGGFFNWTNDRRQHWLFFAAVGLALLLTAGPMAYSVLIIFAIIVLVKLHAFRVLYRRRELESSEPAPSATLQTNPDGQTAIPDLVTELASPLPPENRQYIDLQPPPPASRLLLFFLVCFTLLATAATFNLSGLSVTSSFFLDWLGYFVRSQPEAGFNAVFLLTIYDPLLVIAGLAGLAYAFLGRDLLKQLFAGWFVGLLILDFVMTGRPGGSVVLPLVPLAFLAALALTELWQGLQQEGSWGNEGLLLVAGLVIGALAYIKLTESLVNSCILPPSLCQSTPWLEPVLLLVIPLIFLIIVFFFGLITNARSAARGIALTGVVMSLLITISIAWRLNYGPLMDLAYQPLSGIPSSTELVALTNTLADESSRRMGGEKTALDTTVAGVNNSALLWRLRNYPNLTIVDSLAGTQATSAIITLAQTKLDLSAPYMGQDFAINAAWSPVGLTPKELLKWLIYRQVQARPQGGQVVLWLRADGD